MGQGDCTEARPGGRSARAGTSSSLYTRRVTAPSETNIATLIVRRDGVNGGRPCLAGTGLSVHEIAVAYQRGMDGREILEQFPHVDLARIHAAIAYYLVNKAQLDAELAEEERQYWAMMGDQTTRQ